MSSNSRCIAFQTREILSAILHKRIAGQAKHLAASERNPHCERGIHLLKMNSP